jgi:hypothetical protein
MSPRRGSKPRRTDRLVVGRTVTLTFGDSLVVVSRLSSVVSLESALALVVRRGTEEEESRSRY